MKEDTKKWIEFAEMDLKVSKLTYQNGIYTYSAYHAQQAAEKYLKAYLIEKEEFNPQKAQNTRHKRTNKSMRKHRRQLYTSPRGWRRQTNNIRNKRKIPGIRVPSHKKNGKRSHPTSRKSQKPRPRKARLTPSSLLNRHKPSNLFKRKLCAVSTRQISVGHGQLQQIIYPKTVNI